jgi:hypothetical protein
MPNLSSQRAPENTKVSQQFRGEEKLKMSRAAAVELDFFAMGKENKSSPSKSKFLNRQRSFRGLFSVPLGFSLL